MPAEIMLLPRWAPFHLSKVSYWSRTVIVPLLVLTALKPKALNPRAVNIRELFVVPPEEERTYLTNPTGSAWGNLFLAIDKALRICEPLLPKNARQRSIQAALDWIAERLNGEDGLGGIFPAMANAVMAYRSLGYAPDHPQRAIAMESIRKLLVLGETSGYCEPCMSPIWDTVLAMNALMEAGVDGEDERLRRAADWLIERQILEAYDGQLLLALLGEIFLGARVDDLALDDKAHVLIGVEDGVTDDDLVQAGVGCLRHAVHLEPGKAGLDALFHRNPVGESRGRERCRKQQGPQPHTHDNSFW